MIPSLSEKATEQTDHGQSQSLDHRDALHSVVVVDLIAGFSAETAEAAARMAEGLHARCCNLGLKHEGVNAETAETAVRMAESCAALLRRPHVGWWLSSLGYTVPNEISVR